MEKSWLKKTSVIIPLTKKNYLNKILKELLGLNFKEIVVITNIKNIKINKPRIKFIFSENLKNVSKTHLFFKAFRCAFWGFGKRFWSFFLKTHHRIS